MPSDQASNLQQDGLDMERRSVQRLDDVNDARLSLRLEDGRTLRQAIHDLTDLYDEKLEQLLWTKWGQRIGRSEARHIVSKLQAARSRFSALLSGYDDDQLHVKTNAANNASARDIAVEVFDAERQTMEMIDKALRE
jgi:hypothetical protein